MTRGETANFKGGNTFEYDFQAKERNLKKTKCIICNKQKARRQFYGSKNDTCIRCR